MSIQLINRHGLASLPFFFVLNLAFTVAYVLLAYISEPIAFVVGMLYSGYLLLQTKIIAVLSVLLLVGGTIISGFTMAVTVEQTLLAFGVIVGGSIVCHGLAYLFTSVTGI